MSYELIVEIDPPSYQRVKLNFSKEESAKKVKKFLVEIMTILDMQERVRIVVDDNFGIIINDKEKLEDWEKSIHELGG